ncbi:MAG TPA: ABC transporter permease, partial [Polyangiaceae bacterium]|nr:ABC transporter permease [Polyangiaceae bacterium]
LRRVLLMIPTFFGISLVIFVVLNLAPGRPGAIESPDLAKNARNEQSEQSYRIFREQFDLDKPVLFNARFALARAEVATAVETAAGTRTATVGEKLAAQHALEDYGEYAVPHLVSILNAADAAHSMAVRDSAVYFLRLAAARRLLHPFDAHPSAETKAYNDEVEAETAEIRDLRYPLDAPEDAKRPVIEAWKKWYSAHATRFRHGTSDEIRIFFLETRFARYWANLLRLDFGVSLVNREPVLATLVSKLKYSLSLSVTSLVLSYLIAIPLGVFSAVWKDSRVDHALTLVLFMLYSLPSFFVATLLLYFFSEGSNHPALRWFPTGGFHSVGTGEMTTLGSIGDVLWHLALPLACLTYGSLAALSRYMRTGLLDVIRADYVRTARAKGLPERSVIGKHALRNALLPVLTLLAGLLPAILGGSVIIEYIFGIPGMGLWVVEAIYQRDYNVVLVVELFSTILVLVGILLTDLSYALVDPRIRYE